MSLLASLAIGGGSLFLNKLLNKGNAQARQINPGRLTSLASARGATRGALTQANIKQAGAASGAPVGAISSALASAGIQSPLGDASLDQQAIGVKQFNIGQQNYADQVNRQRSDDITNLGLAGLGTLSKIAILSKMGLLSPFQEKGEDDGLGGIDLGNGELSAINPDELQKILTS